VLFLDQRPELRLLLGLGLVRHRKMEERNVVRGRELVGVAMVGHDRHRVHRQSTDAVSVQQIVEAMIELRDHDQHARPRLCVVQRPAHREALADRYKRRGQRGAFRRDLETLEQHAHHEPVGVHVAELCTVDDVAAVVGEEAADGADDARPVTAGQGQDGLRMRRRGRRHVGYAAAGTSMTRGTCLVARRKTSRSACASITVAVLVSGCACTASASQSDLSSTNSTA
jgi:hypothetical protein